MNLSKFFETGDRNGEAFVSLKESAPAWLREAVREAHKGTLPNDWIYAECEAACQAIDDGAIDEGETWDYVDSRVDIYTRDLFAWAAQFCLQSIFSDAEDNAKDLISERPTVEGYLRAIQFDAIDSIVVTMLGAYNQNKEEAA